MPARERRLGRGSTLFAIYAVASLVPVLALGLILFAGYRHEALDRALGQGEAQAAVIEQMAIAPVLGRKDLRHGITLPERRRLLSATQLSIFSGSVARLRVRSFAGRVLFSDNGLGSGAPPPSTPAFRTAARGGRDAALVRDPTGGPDEVIRVMEPITPNASGRSTGVLEVYLPYRATAAKVEAQLHRTTARMVAALVALYLVLALISWYTTRRLRRHAAEREHEALHDPLTGLPNRALFRERAERATREGERGAIAIVDLDRFKAVNDTLGHLAGDELLVIAARRLTAALRTDDTVARLGGDEFGLILPGLDDPEAARELLTRCRDALAAEVMLEDVELGIEGSFGAALYPLHGNRLEDLMRRADAAMYEGKHGTAGVVVYKTPSAPQGTPWLVMRGELRHALERDELVLHYQPKLDLATRRVTGVEALLRWQHPERGLLAPAAFLPAAEQSGLIEPLTDWVLRRAVADRREWTAAGADWPVSVNVSARNLGSPDFPARVLAALEEAGADPGDICLEVTETAIAADGTAAERTLAALAEHGIAVSMDDFGTGYTSLCNLRTLPVSEVKVDRTFVTGLEGSEHDRSIVRAIIELGHALGCSVTAEGVESAVAAEWLRGAGCDLAQGFHFARPAPWPELLERYGPAIRAGERRAATTT